MKLRNTAIILTCVLFSAMLTGCGKDEPAVSHSEGTQQAQSAGEQETTQAAAPAEMHIVVETAEISLADLKAQDYTVPVHVYLEKNAGITYSEWGLTMDERCTFAVETDSDEPMALSVFHAENPEQHFIWTAWASGTQVMTSKGLIMIVNVTLPEDAQTGTLYTVDYADWSLADKPHVWSSDENDWAAQDEVTWIDGGVLVTE